MPRHLDYSTADLHDLQALHDRARRDALALRDEAIDAFWAATARRLGDAWRRLTQPRLVAPARCVPGTC